MNIAEMLFYVFFNYKKAHFCKILLRIQDLW